MFSATELIDDYLQAADALATAVDGLSPDETRARPIAGKWSVLEVVCHLADSEVYFSDRITRTIALDNPLLIGVDEKPYPERIQYQEQAIDEELSLIAALRRRTARILRRQAADVWERTAIHSEAGKFTLRELVAKTTWHIRHHLGFIEEKRGWLLANRPPVTDRRSQPSFEAIIAWKNTGPDFPRGQYSRRHTWFFDGGITVPASPSPHVVAAPWSVEAAVDPEEALVAAVASCHMLTFLWLAAKRGLTVESYRDQAMGRMAKNEKRIAWVSEILLQPAIEWVGPVPPTEVIADLHHQAHLQCFIANSVCSQVQIRPHSIGHEPLS